MKKFQLVLLVLISLISGCASIHQTFISKEYENEAVGPYGIRNKVYAGIKSDADAVVGCCYMLACICAPIAIIDMPFSIVADTLFLPYTVTRNQRKKNIIEKCTENKRKQAFEAQKYGDTWKDDDIWCKKFIGTL